jgi:hypothetical protein
MGSKEYNHRAKTAVLKPNPKKVKNKARTAILGTVCAIFTTFSITIPVSRNRGRLTTIPKGTAVIIVMSDEISTIMNVGSITGLHVDT